ncbi:MAG: hypothetical protein AAGF73_08995 [Actinomycetota bacterium]
MPDSSEQQRSELRSRLFEAFSEAAGPHAYIPRADAAQLGVHRDFVGSVMHRSHHVRTPADAMEAADEFTELSITRQRETAELTPDQIVAQAQRFM